MELNILLYTHTDYKDAWVPFFGQIKKYLPDAKLHVLVNKHDDNLPKDVTTIYYDDSKLYTERLKYGLNKLNYDEILFIHEDMFLFDKPNIELIEKYLNYIKNDLVDSIKLIYVNDGNEIISHIDQTLILNSFSKFCVLVDGFKPMLLMLSFILAALAILVLIPPGCTQVTLTGAFSMSNS